MTLGDILLSSIYYQTVNDVVIQSVYVPCDAIVMVSHAMLPYDMLQYTIVYDQVYTIEKHTFIRWIFHMYIRLKILS